LKAASAPGPSGNGEKFIYPKCVWLLTVFVKKKLHEQLGLHCYAVSTHPDELVLEPPLKKSWFRL